MGYVILYRICMMGAVLPLAVLTVQTLDTEDVRMGQGLLGLVRSIGSSLGVTVTSVFFERRRVLHQLLAYSRYDNASPEHHDTLNELKQYLHQAGMTGSTVDRAALGTIRRQMDIEAVAAGFRDSFLLICLCFLFASLPMIYLLFRRRREA